MLVGFPVEYPRQAHQSPPPRLTLFHPPSAHVIEPADEKRKNCLTRLPPIVFIRCFHSTAGHILTSLNINFKKKIKLSMAKDIRGSILESAGAIG